MKKLLFVAALAAAASGCVVVGPSNANSLLTLDVQSPDMSFVDNDVRPAKMGAEALEGPTMTQPEATAAIAATNSSFFIVVIP